MTAVVGLVDKKKILIGADSAGFCGNLIVQRRDEKVFMAGEFLIGIAGSFRMGKLLRYSLPNHLATQHQDMDDETFMNTFFIQALKECFGADNFTFQRHGERFNGSFLAAYRGNLYHIDTDFQVGMVYENHMAIGSGAEYCYGSLFSTEKKSSKERVVMALAAASKYCPSVCEPFTVKEVAR